MSVCKHAMPAISWAVPGGRDARRELFQEHDQRVVQHLDRLPLCVVPPYRLMAAWLLVAASPHCNGNLSSIQLPLPTPPPPEFACIPEHFIEDLADVLLYVSRYAPQVRGSSSRRWLCLGGGKPCPSPH